MELKELTQHLNKINIPRAGDRIYKDECVYSFDTPDSPAGLYVSLTTFLGLSQDHLERYYAQTGDPVYLHIKRTRKEIPSEEQGDGPEKKITRLAIGTVDGFMPDQQKYTYDETYKIIILPNFVTINYPQDNLPGKVENAIKTILQMEGAWAAAQVEAVTSTWDGEIRQESKHAANLKQLDNGKKIPPSGWKCEKCDLTQNLWLNLTDGSILCGRKFYDGSGGNGHAVEHYQATGYPLAVKLGTITKGGKADVYSYDEDDMVEDPYLTAHLSHWGINIAQMEKTEKSMIELELDLNQKFGEWVSLQEAASKLTPLYGPGYTGLTNLGNSCYLNSVIQTLFIIPDFIKKYVEGASEIFQRDHHDPASNVNVQMAKLGVGLLSGKYSEPPSKSGGEDDSRKGIPPRMFKVLIGRGHPDFFSNRQQDAQEFLLYLINLLDRNNRREVCPTECFKFKVEERYQCDKSNKVKYTHRPEYILPLPIPVEAAVNKDEVIAYEMQKKETEAKGQKLDSNTLVRPRIKLSSCLETFSRSEIVEQFYSSALNEKTTAHKTTRLASFPDYLLLHLKKFTVKEDWTPIKLDVAVEMPDTVDLSFLRGNGLQPGEELLPDGVTPPPLVFDAILLNELSKMGFPPNACKRALYFTENRSLDDATTWLMEHIADSDYDDSFVPPGIDVKSNKDEKFVADEAALEMVMSMGFTREQATKALKATNNNLERAADWIFSHQAELDTQEMDTSATPAEETFRDGNGRYKLVGFISHMGTSTMVGHYVCHLLKEGRWVIFNDEKVALSENPPKELGYIYMYQRID